MRWIESNLLDLGKVILRVLVENELIERAPGELFPRPDVSRVKDVGALLLPQFLGLFGGHGLNLKCPPRKFTLLDRLVEVFLRIIGAMVGRIRLGDKLHVQLAVNPCAIFVDKLDGVAQVPCINR